MSNKEKWTKKRTFLQTRSEENKGNRGKLVKFFERREFFNSVTTQIWIDRDRFSIGWSWINGIVKSWPEYLYFPTILTMFWKRALERKRESGSIRRRKREGCNDTRTHTREGKSDSVVKDMLLRYFPYFFVSVEGILRASVLRYSALI